MDLREGEHIIFEGHPSWRAILSFYLKALAIAVMVGAIGWLAFSAGVGVAVALGVFVVAVIVGFIRRMATTYSITNQRLRIRRGIISRNVQETRVDRIQNVNTDQGVLERILQVGTVDYDTAGTDDADFAFAGVGQPEKVAKKVEQALHEASQAQAQGLQQQGLTGSPPPPPPPPPPATA
ncbi:MAG TPA: PH domain-containing protein [Solirubrobacteraceae bacterium]|nr:PH domain-containing protein [Solirubrobacteraceae bacterium]